MITWRGIVLTVGGFCHECCVFGCRFGLAGLYGPGLPMLHTSNLVLNALLAHRKPALFRHLQHQLAVPASLYATPWLMSGYISRCVFVCVVCVLSLSLLPFLLLHVAAACRCRRVLR